MDVMVEDLSAIGFGFTSAISIAAGTHVRIGLAGGGRADAEVTWHKGDRHGCIFTPPLTLKQGEAAFTHAPGELATLTVLANTDVNVQLAPEVRRQGALPIHFALTALAGGLCWTMLAMLLRGF